MKNTPLMPARLTLFATVVAVVLGAACGSPGPAVVETPVAAPAAVASPTISPTAHPGPSSSAALPPSPVAAPTSPPASPAPLPGETPPAVNETGLPLTLPVGLRITLFTPPDTGALRFMAFTPDGILLVSMPSPGGLYSRGPGGAVLALPDLDRDGVADEVRTAISGLDNLPHGLAVYDGYLYVAGEDRVSRFPYQGNGEFGAGESVVEGLPDDGGHVSRTVGFSTFGMMYLSIGSSCNACEERDERRAAIMEYRPDGSGGRVYASGLRNSVGFVFHPDSGAMWATENGRDHLGEDLPPDEINIVRSGQDYGWPHCYGDRVPDPFRDDSGRCEATAGSVHDIQAHSAPLGLRFVDSPQLPPEWQGDLLVAYHGSWNRREPTGYKVVRLDVEGDGIRGEEDFIYGWLREDGSRLGRPVDLIFGPDDGALYISDDFAGVVYRVTKAP